MFRRLRQKASERSGQFMVSPFRSFVMRAPGLIDPQFYLDFLPHRAWYWLYWRLFTMRQRRQEAIDLAWDEQHGTQTAGDVPLIAVGVSPDDAGRGHNTYRPVWEHKFNRAMRVIAPKIADFTFVDYGSGKGKVLLMASDYPFRKILGMEYSPVLHEEALRNISRYRSSTQRCREVTSVYQDALTFEPPEGPLVCFLGNAFDDATFDVVLNRIAASFQKFPRPMYLIALSLRTFRECPGVKAMLEEMLSFRPVYRDLTTLIYESRYATVGR
jgi:hypothetical protein